jgi:hypothetical protein
MSKSLRAYIHARTTAANRDIIMGSNTRTCDYSQKQNIADKEYRIDVDNPYSESIPIMAGRKNTKRSPRKNTVRSSRKNSKNNREDSDRSEELIDRTDTLGDEIMGENESVSIDYITERDHLESESIEPLEKNDSEVRTEINSFLIGLENRYTDQTPFKLWNRMYTIGLDIAVSSYSEKRVRKIIEQAINDSTNQLENTLDEVRVYNKKKVIEYIQAGIKDGMSSDYTDIYMRVLNGRSLVNLKNGTAISAHLGTMFSKYADSAHPLDLEQFYNVGVLIANRPFDRERMVEKLNKQIDERSKDEVIAIQRNKRAQLLEKINRGFQDSLNEKTRNAYDLNGKYNYGDRERLRIRARIDALLKRTKK